MRHSWPILNMVFKVSILTTSEGGRPPQPFFENRKKVPWFWKTGALFVCICELNFHLKCSSKSILDKRVSWGLFIVCHTWNVYRTVPIPRNCPATKNSWLRAWTLCQKKSTRFQKFVRLLSANFASIFGLEISKGCNTISWNLHG